MLNETALPTPIALIPLVDETHLWFKSCLGLPGRETPRELCVCTRAIEQEGVFGVENAAQNPKFEDNPLVTGEPRIRIHAGGPIFAGEGRALGTLCVIDRTARQFSERDRTLLSGLSGCAMNAITLHSQGLLLRRADTLIRPDMSRGLVS
ncbi:MAG: GAF domain-containing protein [Oceanicaulis sp.]